MVMNSQFPSGYRGSVVQLKPPQTAGDELPFVGQYICGCGQSYQTTPFLLTRPHSGHCVGAVSQSETPRLPHRHTIQVTEHTGQPSRVS